MENSLNSEEMDHMPSKKVKCHKENNIKDGMKSSLKKGHYEKSGHLQHLVLNTTAVNTLVGNLIWSICSVHLDSFMRNGFDVKQTLQKPYSVKSTLHLVRPNILRSNQCPKKSRTIIFAQL